MINNLSIILFAATLFYITTTSRLGAYVKTLSVQGLLLFFLSVYHMGNTNVGHVIFLGFETLVVKGIVIPLFISHIIKKLEIKRETEPYIENFFSLIVTTVILTLSFVLAVVLKRSGGDVDVLTFGVAAATVVAGLFIVISRKKLITQVMGYLVIENGVFMMSLSLASEVPIIVEAGVLLDVFMGVFLMGIFVHRIKSTFADQEAGKLTRLTD